MPLGLYTHTIACPRLQCAVQVRNADGQCDRFWICQAVDAKAEGYAEANDKTHGCIIEKVEQRGKQINDTYFTKNDMAVVCLLPRFAWLCLLLFALFYFFLFSIAMPSGSICPTVSQSNAGRSRV